MKSYEDDKKLIVSIYVDDLLITSGNSQLVQQLKQLMLKEFAMSDLGEFCYFLRIEVKQNNDNIFLSQKKCAWNILKKFQMEKCKEVAVALVVNKKLCQDDVANKADAIFTEV